MGNYRYRNSSDREYEDRKKLNQVAYQSGRGRHDEVLKFFQAAAKGPNIPGFINDYILGILKWYDKNRYLTRTQGAALDAAYAFLCYQGIIHDSKYPELDLQAASY